MNPHVQQILAMNKAGKITEQEAASLIEEVLRSDDPAAAPRSRRPSGRGDRGFAEPFASLLHTTINRVTGSLAGAASGEADGDDNVIQLSHCDSPSGREGVFRGNRIRMSKVRELTLERSEMTDNHIAASRLDELTLHDARFAQNHINASSIAELRLQSSEIQGLEITSSKCAEVAVTEESVWRGLQVSASVLKELTVSAHTRWIDSAITSSVLAEFAFRNSRLTDCELRTARWRGGQIEDSDWTNVFFHGVTFDRSAFVACRFDDVLFTGEESWGWGKKDSSKARFEHCELKQALFTDCRFQNCLVRGVTLTGIKVRGLELRGQTIEGNEAFLQAVAGHRL
jgi:uncharacterized protein YjbI with pentapeptide repeats